MEMEKHMEYVAMQLKEMEEYCREECEDLSYEELIEEVEKRLEKLREYAEKHDVPMVVEASDIVGKYSEEYYEEESSSYYEEDESEEEDDEDEE